MERRGESEMNAKDLEQYRKEVEAKRNAERQKLYTQQQLEAPYREAKKRIEQTRK